MSEIKFTRLRVVQSKDLELLLAWVNKRPYKIEIKQIIDNGKIDSLKKIYFVPPENNNPHIKSMPLVINLD